MERLTQKRKADGYLLNQTALAPANGGYTGEAAKKLGQLEDLLEDLEKKQEHLSREMEQLKLADKTKTVKFRECMGMKMINSSMLDLLKSYGIF